MPTAGCTPATSASWTTDGYYRVTGRLKDMIIRGGENIYPKEVEEFLHPMEGISDVQVVGVPSHTYGEEVGAFVILQPGAALGRPTSRTSAAAGSPGTRSPIRPLRRPPTP